MTVADFMKRVDTRIFKSKIVNATASFGGLVGVPGAFFMEPRVVELPGGAIMSIGVCFECQYLCEIGTLAEHDSFEVDGYGCFRFLRELQPGGDESGLTIIELGEQVDDA